MGAEAWTTIPSKDGGVDAVATSRHLFFGGMRLIQGKRGTGLVSLKSVYEPSRRPDGRPNTITACSSPPHGSAGPASAKRNRITLINGSWSRSTCTRT